MKHLFYFFWIIFIIYEIFWLLNASEKIKTGKKIAVWNKETKDDKPKYDDYPKFIKDKLIVIFLIVLPAMLFKCLGLLSFNWPIFLTWLVFGLLIIMPLSRLLKNTFLPLLILHTIETYINIAFSLFVILNSYHLKIDFFTLIFK